MGFKDLFIVSEENTTDKPKKTTPVVEMPKTKFPTETENTFQKPIEPVEQGGGLFSSFGFIRYL